MTFSLIYFFQENVNLFLFTKKTKKKTVKKYMEKVQSLKMERYEYC